jgi:hypothetical protein
MKLSAEPGDGAIEQFHRRGPQRAAERSLCGPLQ